MNSTNRKNNGGEALLKDIMFEIFQTCTKIQCLRFGNHEFQERKIKINPYLGLTIRLTADFSTEAMKVGRQ